ncbi:MAG: FkbM family methyltransferase [Gammaproteobacteria bacterium]|nr:FkbM family methyltransferase [Gammaproteobacteria bacterium]MDH3465659.1 FkbM family methyltransferase [Gammaproteobacteria bacterium]
MQDLFRKITGNGCSRLGAVLHLGAGTCWELDEFLRFKPEKVMLVEANAELADRLRLKVRGIAQVEVVGAAVAPAEGEASLYVLNNPRESSLHRPADLLKHYPNLSLSRTVTVPATTLSQLVERLSLDASCDNLLVLEIQGAECSVLSSTPAETLQAFSWIAIRSSTETLYEGESRLEEVNAMLRESGFQTAAPVEQASASPFQEVLYRRDPLQIQLRELKTLLDERDKSVHTLTQSLIEQQNNKKELNHGLERQSLLAEERQAHLAQMTRERDEQSRLAAERQAQLERLTKERDEQAKLATERKVEMERLTKARDEQAKLAQTKQAELDRQARWLQDNQARNAQLESQLTELTKRQTLLSEEMVKAEGQIDVIKYVLLREPET